MNRNSDSKDNQQVTEDCIVDNDIENPEVSKSERKRQMHRLQELGAALVDINQQQFEGLQISDALFEAIKTARSIKKREAQRRQLQFIGKLMRREPESAIRQIEQLLEKIHTREKQQNEQHHLIESWRDRITHAKPGAVDEFVQSYPAADRQWLRNMARQHLREQQGNRPPTAARKIFTYIRETIENSNSS